MHVRQFLSLSFHPKVKEFMAIVIILRVIFVLSCRSRHAQPTHRSMLVEGKMDLMFIQ
jgi:hypothetical protein